MVLRSYVGASVRRKEDPRLITGSSIYVDDLRLADAVHVAFVRSPHAHARIVRIDTSAAAAMPGVLTVMTAADLAPLLKDKYPVVPAGETGEHGSEEAAEDAGIPVPQVEPLAMAKVRYVGEPVAAVAADTEAHAEDALAAVVVEYDELEAVIDPYEARKDGAPRLYAEVPGNLSVRQETVHGDVDGALAAAPIRVSAKIRAPRCHPMPMEPRGTVAAPDPITRGLTVWTSTQAPHGSPQRDRGGVRRRPESGAHDRAGGRRRLRVQDRRLSRGFRRRRARAEIEPAGEVDRDAQRKLSRHQPRPQPVGRSSRSAPIATARSRRCERASCSIPGPTPKRSIWPGAPG